MAFAITNKNLQSNVPGLLIPNVGSTALNQIVSSATATSTSIASSHWEFADYTSTEGWIPKTTQVRDGGIGDFQYEHLAYRALVSLKSLSGYGTATSTFGFASVVLTLETATSTAAFVGNGSTGAPINTVIIDSKTLPQIAGTSTGNVASVYLFGQVPGVGGAKFCRVGFNTVGGATVNVSSTAIDVVIEGVS
jgi:hypothetical protein